eukprot:Gb_05305 [translate_table: standard]
MGWGSFLKAVASNLDIFAGPVVTLLYPLYASVRAIETPSRLDDQQWLTYWVLYSLITLFEITFSRVLEWLPFWPYVKLITICWLVLPIFNGAAYVYENFVRQCLLNPSLFDKRFGTGQKRVQQMMSPGLRSSVERYIGEHGQDAFERVIRNAEREAKGHRGSSIIYDQDEEIY